MYPVIEGLSPQGPDYQKALLRSAVSVPVNDDTRRDLLISIATAGAFDNVDKKDYFTRLQWAEKWVRSVKFEFMCIQPETYQDWHDADEPWQFLALCKEYYDIFVETDPKLRKTSCDVFCFRDATNSGLQVLAGIMRDEKAAYYTNVLATDEPQDAYKLVAEGAKKLMRNPEWMRVEFEKRSQSVAAKNKKRDKDEQLSDPGYSFNFEIDVLNRNHTKTQVMTTLYNSSPLTRRDNILGALKKKNQVEVDPADKSIVVNSCLVSMSREFEGALNLNQWFQSVARAALEKGAENLKWITPSGMFVVNEYREPEFIQVHTYATGGGHYKTLMSNTEGRVYLRNGYGGVKKSKILSSTSANYIHSLDAAIIQLGIQCVPDEVPVYAVHDCIAAVAGTVSGVIPEFRKAFHNIVTSNPLYGLLEENDLIGELEPPEVGDADISQCLESPYMFC
jgi:DNA-directed RNA polymerase